MARGPPKHRPGLKHALSALRGYPAAETLLAIHRTRTATMRMASVTVLATGPVGRPAGHIVFAAVLSALLESTSTAELSDASPAVERIASLDVTRTGPFSVEPSRPFEPAGRGTPPAASGQTAPQAGATGTAEGRSR